MEIIMAGASWYSESQFVHPGYNCPIRRSQPSEISDTLRSCFTNSVPCSTFGKLYSSFRNRRSTFSMRFLQPSFNRMISSVGDVLCCTLCPDGVVFPAVLREAACDPSYGPPGVHAHILQLYNTPASLRTAPPLIEPRLQSESEISRPRLLPSSSKLRIIPSCRESNSVVECKLPKLDVAGSIPVSRSTRPEQPGRFICTIPAPCHGGVRPSRTKRDRSTRPVQPGLFFAPSPAPRPGGVRPSRTKRDRSNAPGTTRAFFFAASPVPCPGEVLPSRTKRDRSNEPGNLPGVFYLYFASLTPRGFSHRDPYGASPAPCPGGVRHSRTKRDRSTRPEPTGRFFGCHHRLPDPAKCGTAGHAGIAPTIGIP